MSIKRFISRFIWICNEFIAKFFIIIFNKRVVVRTLENNFSNKRIMVISPHSDDESIGCFGLIHHLDISPYYWLLCGKNKNRVNEWRRAISEISTVESHKILLSNEIDGKLLECSDRIYIDLIKYLEKYQIDQVFCPSFNDAHPDHIAVSQQVLRALSENYINEAFFYHTNYPLVFDKKLYKFELPEHIKKKKLKTYQIFNSQITHLDFTLLARYQNFVSWLTRAKYCEFFFKIDSRNAKRIISQSSDYDTNTPYHIRSVLNVKNSLLIFLRTLQ